MGKTVPSFIYHVLVDRFTGDVNLPNKNAFLGGTINGVCRRLDYIKSLGCDAVWLSPICKSKNYHGYHVTDFFAVDPHFGSVDDVLNLLSAAHSRGMKVFVDFVPNHCADTHPFFVDALNNVNSHYRDWFYFDNDNSYLCFMNFGELPKLNLDNPVVCDYIIDSAKYWCGLGFDGMRIDHAIGPSFFFWKTFMAQMKSIFPHHLFFGEAWCAGLSPDLFGTVHLKHKWNKLHYGVSQEDLQRDYVGVLDGVLDFEFRNIMLKHIYRGERVRGNNQLLCELKRHFSRYPKSFNLFLFLDNHDTDRILFDCHGDVSLVAECLDFCRGLGHPFIMYYGTELDMTNSQTVFSGKPYADLEVRSCVDWGLVDKR